MNKTDIQRAAVGALRDLSPTTRQRIVNRICANIGGEEHCWTTSGPTHPADLQSQIIQQIGNANGQRMADGVDAFTGSCLDALRLDDFCADRIPKTFTAGHPGGSNQMCNSYSNNAAQRIAQLRRTVDAETFAALCRQAKLPVPAGQFSAADAVDGCIQEMLQFSVNPIEFERAAYGQMGRHAREFRRDKQMGPAANVERNISSPQGLIPTAITSNPNHQPLNRAPDRGTNDARGQLSSAEQHGIATMLSPHVPPHRNDGDFPGGGGAGDDGTFDAADLVDDLQGPTDDDELQRVIENAQQTGNQKEDQELIHTMLAHAAGSPDEKSQQAHAEREDRRDAMRRQLHKNIPTSARAAAGQFSTGIDVLCAEMSRTGHGW